jgi:hypothetical protein
MRRERDREEREKVEEIKGIMMGTYGERMIKGT